MSNNALDKPKKFNLTLNSSGGIALGAFMAGVFFEIIKEALEENSLAIDIITGASAGAMTGAIASYYLLQDRNLAKKAFVKPEGNAFYEAWVVEADMENIDSIAVMPIEEWEIIYKGKNRDPFSLLSGKAIENIADLIKNLPDKVSKISNRLALLVTVTNLQGILVQNEHSEKDDSKSVTNAEVRKFFFIPDSEKNKQDFKSKWEKLVDSSRASGAFPIAFPPIKDSSDPKQPDSNFKDIKLSDDYFEGETLDEKLDIVNDNKLEFSYTDGGILDNLPILKGIEIEADSQRKKSDSPQITDNQKFNQHPSPLPESERHHVYVKPTPVVSLKSLDRLEQTLFTLWEMVLSGLILPKQEQEAVQLERIQAIKEKIELKYELIEKFSSNGELKQKLEREIPYDDIKLSSITPLIIKKIHQQNCQELKPLYDALIKIESPLIEEGLGLKGNDANPKKLLASDFIRAFGGFFDRQYREHDFVLGRICGLAWMQESGICVSQASIEQLTIDIQTKILKKEPIVKISYRVRLTRLFLRFLRIAYLEIKPKKIWILFYYLFWLPTVLVLRFLESILTLLLWASKSLSL